MEVEEKFVMRKREDILESIENARAIAESYGGRLSSLEDYFLEVLLDIRDLLTIQETNVRLEED